MDRRAVLLGAVAQMVAVVIAFVVQAPTVLLSLAFVVAGLAVAVLTESSRREFPEAAVAAGLAVIAAGGIAIAAPGAFVAGDIQWCAVPLGSRNSLRHVAVAGSCWPVWLLVVGATGALLPVVGFANGVVASLARPYRHRLVRYVPWSS